jgi:hypothetical protein
LDDDTRWFPEHTRDSYKRLSSGNLAAEETHRQNIMTNEMTVRRQTVVLSLTEIDESTKEMSSETRTVSVQTHQYNAVRMHVFVENADCKRRKILLKHSHIS